MPDSSEEPVLKRKRVAKACQPCRLMKSKCDGRQPACGRCQGYGFACAYSVSGRRRQKTNASPEEQHSLDAVYSRDAATADPIREALDDYEELVQTIASQLPEPDRTSVEEKVEAIKARVEQHHQELQQHQQTHPQLQISPTAPVQIVRSPVAQSSARACVNSQRYLGEVSDVKFFNLIKKVFQGNTLSDRIDESMDSYEQEDPIIQGSNAAEISLELPAPEVAEQYLDVYFSTIHLAYPYIARSTFLRRYRKLRDSGTTEDIDTSWLALLYYILAIGAYYTSFPGKGTSADTIHQLYYQRALALSSTEVMERSMDQIALLLAKCFYMLAVCRTDSCWTTLGLAIRIGQSIGLHVESEEHKIMTTRALLRAERRRRVWYSLYVLDRLIALQLGRPPAIHDDDCNLPLPSRITEKDIDWESENPQLDAGDGPSMGDYFHAIISFSTLVGYVLRDLYSPRRGKLLGDKINITRNLDKQLTEWKMSLPRTLRFDVGHTFEKSVIFKRLRNMLAIKFHHLRALIHRPYLCFPMLRRVDDPSLGLLEGSYHQVDRYEKICISEAQETAHLLHNVSDEKDLVHDFPWWQMISCLICASSILLVASAFTRRGHPDGDMDAAALNEDAETCLKVFEALSINSDAARIARDMMKRLQDRGNKLSSSERANIEPQVQAGYESQHQPHPHPHPQPQVVTGLEIPAASYSEASLHENFQLGYDGVTFAYQNWPSEISDSMNWSAQFFEAV